jgi:beta-galactosidase GanA
MGMLGVCYYPEHWSEDHWPRDAQRMYDLGLRFVRIGEFAWGRIEKAEGMFDWAWMDRAIDVLAAAGLKIVLGTPTATPPKWLCEKYPDILPVDIHSVASDRAAIMIFRVKHIWCRPNASLPPWRSVMAAIRMWQDGKPTMNCAATIRP